MAVIDFALVEASFSAAAHSYEQAATVQRLHDGAVALSLGLFHVYGVYDSVYLVHRQYLRQPEPCLGSLYQLRGVGLEPVRQHQEVVERLDARQYARLRAGVDADVVQPGVEPLQVIVRHLQEVHSLAVQKVQELLQILLISLDCVGR